MYYFRFKSEPPILYGYLKRFARNGNELEGLLATAKEFSNDIGMTFGLEKAPRYLSLEAPFRKHQT